MSRKKAAEPSAGQPWLAALEARVRDAVERMTALGSENRRLAERVAELEARLAEARSAGGSTSAEITGGKTEGAASAAGEEPADWLRERDEVRRRVSILIETLASLLADREAPD